MKLASYRDGSRDGQLVVVSRDLASAHYATGIATRLQQVLDDWNFLSPQLQALSQSLNHGKARHAFAFDPAQCMAPLPRAFAWVDADLRRASDGFLAPRDGVGGAGSATIDLDARLAVVVGDVDAGIAPDAALERVRLVMLAAEVADGAESLGTAFAPVAVTPDELAPGWQGGRVGFDIALQRNGKRLGSVAAGAGMTRPFGALVAAAAARRGIAAGGIVGSGPLGGGDGSSAAAEPGDVVRIEMRNGDGQSVFGAVEVRSLAAVVPTPVDATLPVGEEDHPR